MTLLRNLIALQYQKNASPCVLRTLLNCMAVQSFKFCHLSCSSPISGSERPDSQPKSARQAGWSFHCLTAPHSSNHKDSQILLCNNIFLNNIFHKGKGHFATGKSALFASSENLGGLGLPCSYAPG